MASRQQDERLARDWHAWAFRYALFLTGNRDRAADLSQDALVRALVRRPNDLAEEAFGSWLRTVMVRLQIDHSRRLTREHTALKRLFHLANRHVDTTDAPSASPLLTALAAMSARQRACVVLRYFEDLPETEVARIVGIRQGTVKAHLARAREILREHLGTSAKVLDLE